MRDYTKHGKHAVGYNLVIPKLPDIMKFPWTKLPALIKYYDKWNCVPFKIIFKKDKEIILEGTHNRYKLSIRFIAVLLKQDNDLSPLKMLADKQAVGFDLMKPHCAGEIN